MFNDLRSFHELRRNYQFWFYQYPSGQPFWVSATQLRADLASFAKSWNQYSPRRHGSDGSGRPIVWVVWLADYRRWKAAMNSGDY